VYRRRARDCSGRREGRINIAKSVNDGIQLYGKVFKTKDFREGVNAFLERESPFLKVVDIFWDLYFEVIETRLIGKRGDPWISN
jgi:hypothetical protein